MPSDADPQIIPYLYYPDATEALDFLVTAFGFEVKSAFRNAAGNVLTAELSIGEGVVMIGPGMDAYGTRAVSDPDWASTRIFVRVDDVESHYERSRAAGARIVSELQLHQFSHHRLYVAADCGGQQWIFAEPVDDSTP